MDNHSVYANEELNSWTGRLGLLDEESYLLEKYLINKGRLIEAGTGGGRVSIEIAKRFDNLEIVAFDFVKDMINNAKTKNKKIDFRVLDASDLSIFKDESFDFAIYLQQIVSLVPFELIPKVIDESYRILKKDGVIIFSFLDYQSREFNPFLSFAVNLARIIRGEKWQKQQLPWLKLGGKVNLGLLGKKQATTYWFEDDEIKVILEDIGFKILEVKKESMLYVVCQK